MSTMQWRLFEKELGSREAQNWPGTNEWPSPWSDGAMNDESVVPKILLPSFVGCAPEAILRVLNLAPKLNNDHAEPFLRIVRLGSVGGGAAGRQRYEQPP